MNLVNANGGKSTQKVANYCTRLGDLYTVIASVCLMFGLHIVRLVDVEVMFRQRIVS